MLAGCISLWSCLVGPIPANRSGILFQTERRNNRHKRPASLPANTAAVTTTSIAVTAASTATTTTAPAGATAKDIDRILSAVAALDAKIQPGIVVFTVSLALLLFS